jgi:isocitrate dehydrogenase
VGTKEFAQAIVARLGQQPEKLPAVQYEKAKQVHQTTQHSAKATSEIKKEFIGVDIFIQWESTADELATHLTSLVMPHVKLTFISNRGVKVWPTKLPETLCSDCWRCRFMRKDKKHSLSYQEIIDLLQAISSQKLEIAQVQSLYLFDAQHGFTALPEE